MFKLSKKYTTYLLLGRYILRKGFNYKLGEATSPLRLLYFVGAGLPRPPVGGFMKKGLFFLSFLMLLANLAGATPCVVSDFSDNPDHDPSFNQETYTFRDLIQLLAIAGEPVPNGKKDSKGNAILVKPAYANFCLDDSAQGKIRKIIFDKSEVINLEAPLPGLLVYQGESLSIEVAAGKVVTIDGGKLKMKDYPQSLNPICGLYIGKDPNFQPDYEDIPGYDTTLFVKNKNASYTNIKGALTLMNFPQTGLCVDDSHVTIEKLTSVKNAGHGIRVTGKYDVLKGVQSISNTVAGLALEGYKTDVLAVKSNDQMIKSRFDSNGESGVYIASNENYLNEVQASKNQAYGILVSEGKKFNHFIKTIAYDNNEQEGGSGIYFNPEVAPQVIDVPNFTLSNTIGKTKVVMAKPEAYFGNNGQIQVYLASSDPLKEGAATQAYTWIKNVTYQTSQLNEKEEFIFEVSDQEIKDILKTSQLSENLHFTFSLESNNYGSSAYSPAYRKPDLLILIVPIWDWIEILKNLPPDFFLPIATPTPGVTPVPTPQATPTPGATPQATPTPGVTPKPTPTVNPLATPTPSVTASPVATPTTTPAATPSVLPFPTPTPTPVTEIVCQPGAILSNGQCIDVSQGCEEGFELQGNACVEKSVTLTQDGSGGCSLSSSGSASAVSIVWMFAFIGLLILRRNMLA